MDFAACFKMEFEIVKQLLEGSDFAEGVDAMLISKTKNPKWNPSTLEKVNVDSFFTPKKENKVDLKLLTNTTFKSYPVNVGLPTEIEIKKLVTSGSMKLNMQEVIDHFKWKREGPKLGVEKKVRELLKRKCVVEGAEEWITWK